MSELKLLGSPAPVLREHHLSKTGPIQTDQSFYIIDAPFKQLLTKGDLAKGADGSGKDGVWDVDTLAARIKDINGVLEVGIFHGENGEEIAASGVKGRGGQKPIAVYFGLADGSVDMKHYKDLPKGG
jgi:ribose 5-phosphate isomerase A